jgi:hypothetical protein
MLLGLRRTRLTERSPESLGVVATAELAAIRSSLNLAVTAALAVASDSTPTSITETEGLHTTLHRLSDTIDARRIAIDTLNIEKVVSLGKG